MPKVGGGLQQSEPWFPCILSRHKGWHDRYIESLFCFAWRPVTLDQFFETLLDLAKSLKRFMGGRREAGRMRTGLTGPNALQARSLGRGSALALTSDLWGHAGAGA